MQQGGGGSPQNWLGSPAQGVLQAESDEEDDVCTSGAGADEKSWSGNHGANEADTRQTAEGHGLLRDGGTQLCFSMQRPSSTLKTELKQLTESPGGGKVRYPSRHRVSGACLHRHIRALLDRHRRPGPLPVACWQQELREAEDSHLGDLVAAPVGD